METQSKYLWMDKYTPRTLSALTFNPLITKILFSLSQKSDFPHLIFYGPDGSGKKTRIHCFLESLYGSGIYKMNTETKDLKINSTTISYTISSSNYHLELSPSDNENYDRFIISKVIKESSSVMHLDFKSQRKFKVIVLLDCDNLTKEAQSALRRTMEKYSKNCRIIISVNNLSKIIPPISSRCLALRICSPSQKELFDCLVNIKNSENINNISNEQIDLIVKHCDRNIRMAINCLQLSNIENYSKDIFIPEYLISIKEICKKIKEEQSPNSLKLIRNFIMNLLINGISADIIILNICKEMIKLENDENKKREIIYWSAFYDNRSQNGSKELFHIEALIAKLMFIQAKIN
jgi:replication factor C subunit 3/5